MTDGSATRKSPRTANGRRSRQTTARLIAELDRVRIDSGLSIGALARGAAVSKGYLSQVIAGQREPSISVLTALATALGGDLSIRLYPNTGPVIRDRIQARIVEALIRVAAPSWRSSVEVAVTRPARGSIDLVLDDARRRVAVCTEVQSRIDRLEQHLRWMGEKAASLPSADLWPFLGDEPTIHRLLVLRSTATTREVVRRFELTLAAAYPARCEDVFDALSSVDVPWPGSGILWADVRGEAVTIMRRPPRGVPLGR